MILRTSSMSAFRALVLFFLAMVFIAVNAVLRAVLQVFFPEVLPFSSATESVFFFGIINDAGTLAYVLLLPATMITLAGDRFLAKHAGRFFVLALTFVFSTVVIFTAFAEFFFWEEFQSRFNFIAVDYLIYTTELTRNALESYPVWALLLAVLIFSLGTTWLADKVFYPKRIAETQNLRGGLETGPSLSGSRSLLRRLKGLAACYAVAVAAFLFFTPLNLSGDRFLNEFGKNGIYEIFSAFRHNELDYRAFYQTMNKDEAFAVMRDSFNEAGNMIQPYLGDEFPVGLPGARGEKRPNVVVVIMESMGTKWHGKSSPYLAALSAQGLNFSNMMSTGTRTVRGIEAVMLSIPPTPGNSIVRRPDNDGLCTLGTPFKERGYDLTFIYGGLGYFDNMNDFFADNGYRTVDSLSFAHKNDTFSNAWGQCDEDLYAESLDRADASFAAGQPFHQVLLTTSNHRPFTWPENAPVPKELSGTREGAVMYSDYAVGQFMTEARKKPWFDNTIFVFVGDHPSSIAGKAEIPPDAYGIICFIYGPAFINPAEADILCSQIDLAPTLLSVLGWEYTAPFFGEDILEMAEDEGRAWLSTYQLLGLRDNENMIVLSPDGKAMSSGVVNTPGLQELFPIDEPKEEELRRHTVASYQSAYDLYVSGALKETAVRDTSVNSMNGNMR